MCCIQRYIGLLQGKQLKYTNTLTQFAVYGNILDIYVLYHSH